MKQVIRLLREADITVNGDQPWDIHIKNKKVYNRVIRKGSLGLGESYMDGWWEVEQLDAFFDRVLRSKLDEKFTRTPQNMIRYLKAWALNLQTKSKASSSIIHHYDIGHDLYRAMLDKRMVYTCAFWDNATTLDEAQEAKLDLICQKLNVKSDDHILDIGCGWGSFARFAAEKYGARVTGVTISKDQAKYGRQLCEGLPVEIRLQDYRDVSEKYDKIVSLGMMEHVGQKNYKTYLNTAARALKDDGLFLIQVIGRNTSAYKADAWISKYIFPNGMLPSIKQIGKALENTFVMEDWHNFGPYYDKTLMAWFDNFDHHWDELKNNYSERFYRMWKYYLLSCAGAFRSRSNQLWQIVLSKEGIEGGYQPLRYSELGAKEHMMEK
ncbi:cyclopropane fatty acyl phospholipid synthase [Membranicola marinus]|uniref:Cyclopropane fatty acyl phospholipid synthase n=1 Tax=Membranihabitans marinus TaxID=1227546 RepID=A0A953HQP9_9BACT|nr:cyclopropane fatty acyl phospholipid synthase [Membranihabitans marinus]MBY5960022.1 cyclopropane fatty acyl phospholipid synthase [Membranihabitans marinus]